MSSSDLLTFDEAKIKLLNAQHINYLIEEIPLLECLNRIAAEDLFSPFSVPSFANSAMDGFAVRFKDLETKQGLPIGGTVLAGEKPPSIWKSQSCLKIMTGAEVPKEADAVVALEHTEQIGNLIYFKKPVHSKQNIRFPGEDIAKNERVIKKGERLTIPLLSQLSTLGVAKVSVFKPVRVALFSTGNELLPPGMPPQPGKIYDSNRMTLLLLLKQLRCDIIDLGIIEDDPKKIVDALENAASNADIIITSGGVSVGEADHIKSALEALGKINFWKLAMKPGKPFAYGRINSTVFCGLPGNPVSAFTTFYHLVQPLIMRLSGANDKTSPLPKFQVRTLNRLSKKVGRMDFQRGKLIVNSAGELCVQSMGFQHSHLTSSFSRANCFIILEADCSDVMAGEYVTVEPFNHLIT